MKVTLSITLILISIAISYFTYNSYSNSNNELSINTTASTDSNLIYYLNSSDFNITSKTNSKVINLTDSSNKTVSFDLAKRFDDITIKNFKTEFFNIEKVENEEKLVPKSTCKFIKIAFDLNLIQQAKNVADVFLVNDTNSKFNKSVLKYLNCTASLNGNYEKLDFASDL